MHASKLIKTLKLLSPAEIKSFGDFVHSPWFNKNEKLNSLIDILLGEYPKFEGSTLGKEILAQSLFGNDPKKEQKLNDHFSYLVTLLQEFLAFSGFKNDEILKKLYSIKKLQGSETDKEFERLSGQVKQKLESGSNKNFEYHYHFYLLEGEIDQYILRKNARDNYETFQHKVDSLDAFYLSEKLKSICEMLNREKVLASSYEPQIKEYIISNSDFISSVPSVMLYFHAYNMLFDPDNEEHFVLLKEELESNHHLFPVKEIRELYDYLQNFCIRNINKGRTDYLGILHDLYKSLLDKNIIYEKGFISEWDYKNIVSTGLRLKDYSWTEKFITDNKDKLHAEVSENAYIYNLATLYYERKDYKKAVSMLREIEFTDVFYALGARSVILKTYFEMDELDNLYSHLESFKTYLRRNKLISESQKTNYKNLLKYTGQLARMKEEMEFNKTVSKTGKLNSLKEEVQHSKNTANVSWLLEQIGKL